MEAKPFLIHIDNGGIEISVQKIDENGRPESYLKIGANHFGIKTNEMLIPMTPTNLEKLGNYLINQSKITKSYIKDETDTLAYDFTEVYVNENVKNIDVNPLNYNTEDNVFKKYLKYLLSEINISKNKITEILTVNNALFIENLKTYDDYIDSLKYLNTIVSCDEDIESVFTTYESLNESIRGLSVYFDDSTKLKIDEFLESDKKDHEKFIQSLIYI